MLNLQILRQSVGTNIKKVLFNAAKESMNLEKGKAVLQVPKEEISSLPKVFQDLVTGLNNPSITIAKKTSKGQCLFGLAVKDGEKPAEKFALSLDKTRGTEPIYQFRHQAFNEGEKFLGEHHNMDLSAAEIRPDGVTSAFTTKNGIAELSVENGKLYSLNKQLNIEGSVKNINSQRSQNPIKMLKELQEELQAGKMAERINQQREAFHTETPFFIKKINEISTMDLKTIEKSLVEYKNKADSLEKEILEMYSNIKTKPKESLKLREVLSDVYDGMPYVDETGKKASAITNELREKIIQYDSIKRILFTLSEQKVNKYSHRIEISDSRILEILKELNAKIPKYKNKTTVKELMALKDKSSNMSKEEVTQEAVNIICKELGLNPKLIKIEYDDSIKAANCNMAFINASYSLKIEPDLFSKVDFEDYVSLLRHELQHTLDFSQFAKHKSWSNYSGLLELCGVKSENINGKVWKKVLKQTKTNKINLNQQESNFLYYTTPDMKHLEADVFYFNNYFERRAYRKQFQLSNALRGQITSNCSTVIYIDTILAKQLHRRLNKIFNLCNENKEKTLKILHDVHAKSFSTATGFDSAEYSINHWKEMIRLMDEQIVKLEKAKSMKKQKINVQA